MEEARPMKVEKLSSCGPFNSPKACHHLIVKQSLSRLVLEGLDQEFSIVRETSYYQRITRRHSVRAWRAPRKLRSNGFRWICGFLDCMLPA